MTSGAGVTVGGIGVAVGGTGVAVGNGVAVGSGVAVGGTGVAVGREVAVGGEMTAVDVATGFNGVGGVCPQPANRSISMMIPTIR